LRHRRWSSARCCTWDVASPAGSDGKLTDAGGASRGTGGACFTRRRLTADRGGPVGGQFHLSCSDGVSVAGRHQRRPSGCSPGLLPPGGLPAGQDSARPSTDWGDRLLGGFALDVRAAHDLLGPAAADATLIGVEVPAGHANWVRPGSCANRVGYWHVAGARVLYRSGGAVRSFGIKSLISWRGTWYVVHLGAVVHPAAHGEVDHPASGSGSFGAAGGC